MVDNTCWDRTYDGQPRRLLFMGDNKRYKCNAYCLSEKGKPSNVPFPLNATKFVQIYVVDVDFGKTGVHEHLSLMPCHIGFPHASVSGAYSHSVCD